MMRQLWLFLSLGLVAPLALSQQPVSLALQPIIVQKNAAVSTGSVASLANVFPLNNLKGDTIIVVFANGNGNQPTAPMSDTNSNTYYKAVAQLNGAGFYVAIWYATNVAAGPNTVTVTPGGSNASIASEVYEVSGLLALSPQVLDQINSTTATGTSLSTGAVTPLLPNEFAFAAFGVGTAAQTITLTNTNGSYSNDSGQQNPTTPAGLFSFVSASSYLTATLTTNAVANITSEPWAAALATFRAIAVPVQGTVIASQSLATSLNATVVQPTGSNLHAVLDSPSTTVVTQATGTNLHAVLDTTSTTAVTQATGTNLHAVTDPTSETNVVTTATTTDTALRCTLVSAASTNATNCKASAGNVYGYRFVNTTATLYYLRMYNASSAPTCSSATGFIESIPIPASATGAGIVAIEPMGEGYSTGIGFCFTGGPTSTDNTNAAVGVYGSILYK